MPPAPLDPRALRARLLERMGALKAYFEATSVSIGLKAPYWGAFDALRRNQPLAEAFVAELQKLLELLENDVVPALDQALTPQLSHSGPRTASIPEQETQVIATLTPVEIADDAEAGPGLALPPTGPSASAKSSSVFGTALAPPRVDGPGSAAEQPPSPGVSSSRVPSSRPTSAAPPVATSSPKPASFALAAAAVKSASTVPSGASAEMRLSDSASLESVNSSPARSRDSGPQRVVSETPLSKRAAALMIAAFDAPGTAGTPTVATISTEPIGSDAKPGPAHALPPSPSLVSANKLVSVEAKPIASAVSSPTVAADVLMAAAKSSSSGLAIPASAVTIPAAPSAPMQREAAAAKSAAAATPAQSATAKPLTAKPGATRTAPGPSVDKAIAATAKPAPAVPSATAAPTVKPMPPTAKPMPAAPPVTAAPAAKPTAMAKTASAPSAAPSFASKPDASATKPTPIPKMAQAASISPPQPVAAAGKPTGPTVPAAKPGFRGRSATKPPVPEFDQSDIPDPK